MARVLLAIPSFSGNVKSLCWASSANLDWGGDEVTYAAVNGWFADRARNEMARMALEGEYDYLFMVDSDIILPPDALVRLREAAVDVATGYYVRGLSDDGRTCAIPLGDMGYGGGYFADVLRDRAARGISVIEVKGNGLGCALVRTSVFNLIDAPWFAYRHAPELGEDYWFCERCREAGVEVHVVPSVACGHVHDRILEA